MPTHRLGAWRGASLQGVLAQQICAFAVHGTGSSPRSAPGPWQGIIKNNNTKKKVASSLYIHCADSSAFESD
jgi:hypothetical protein